MSGTLVTSLLPLQSCATFVPLFPTLLVVVVPISVFTCVNGGGHWQQRTVVDGLILPGLLFPLRPPS